MRRMIALSVLMALMTVGLALAVENPDAKAPETTPTAAASPADSAQPPSQAACGPVDITKMSDADRDAWLAQRGLKMDLSQRTVGPPPCPPLDGCGAQPSCTGSNWCAQTQTTSATETFNSSCSIAGGGTLTCSNGQEIYAYTYNCQRCPCCDLPPGQRCACAPTCPSVGHGYGCGDPM